MENNELSKALNDKVMLSEELLKIGANLCSIPTAPGFEHHVRNQVLALLADLPHCTTRLDEFGNVITIYDHDSADREPIRLVAHMDHPAFVVQGSDLVLRGGVKDKYLVGKRVRFHSLETLEPLGTATIQSIKEKETAKSDQLVSIDGPIPAGAQFAVWDLPLQSPPCDKMLFHSPACDDLVQVATMIALIRRLAQSESKACVHALFTRSEETGFYGALAAIESRDPLPKLTTISLEISNSIGFCEVGTGPILRVGDRITVFDSDVTYWLADSLSKYFEKSPEPKPLPFQRLLMAGGACEASVFHHAGFPTGGLCLAMFNYHNMGPNDAILSETVSLYDWQSLFDGLFYLATEAGPISQSKLKLELRLGEYRKAALAALG